MRRFLPLISGLIFSGLLAQDKVFLRDAKPILECIILEVNDTVIVYRSIRKKDTTLYRMPLSRTYGYLLEDHSGEVPATAEWVLSLHHPAKSRTHIFKTGQSLIYRLRSDSTHLFPRTAKIIRIGADSLELEFRERKHIHRQIIHLNEISTFGHSNLWTDVVNLILFPFPSPGNRDPGLYYRMDIAAGWKWKTGPWYPGKR